MRGRCYNGALPRIGRIVFAAGARYPNNAGPTKTTCGPLVLLDSGPFYIRKVNVAVF